MRPGGKAARARFVSWLGTPTHLFPFGVAWDPLKDVGLAALWPQAVALSAFAAVVITLSVRRFSKTLE